MKDSKSEKDEEPFTLGRNYLEVVPGAERLTIPATDGTETIKSALDVFHTFEVADEFLSLVPGAKQGWSNVIRGFIDSEIAKTDRRATQEVIVQLCDPYDADGFSRTFEEILEDKGWKLEQLTLTEAQIVSFCRKFPEHIPNNDVALRFFLRLGGEVNTVEVNRNCIQRVRVIALGFQADHHITPGYARFVIPRHDLRA